MPMTFIQAIARMEGFGAKPDNIPTSHNNPGDIRAGQWANAHGAVPAAPDPRWKGANRAPSPYAVFPSPSAGWLALRQLLAAAYAGMSVQEAIGKYAPATENDTEQYVDLVCAWTGLQPDTILTQENIG